MLVGIGVVVGHEIKTVGEAKGKHEQESFVTWFTDPRSGGCRVKERKKPRHNG